MLCFDYAPPAGNPLVNLATHRNMSFIPRRAIIDIEWLAKERGRG